MSVGDPQALFFGDEQTAVVALQAALDGLLRRRSELQVLEAGCGSASHVRVPSGAHVVGIDISPEQLAANDTVQERILGDIQSYPLPQRRFDLIVCWDVLEHLERPLDALERFADAAHEGGLILIKVPNVLSLKGVATKYTPHAVHRWVYRRTMPFVEGDPFPTFLRLAMSPRSLESFARRRGLDVAYKAFWEAWLQHELRKRFHVPAPLWRAACRLVSVATLGRIEVARTDYVVLFRRGGDDTATGA